MINLILSLILTFSATPCGCSKIDAKSLNDHYNEINYIITGRLVDPKDWNSELIPQVESFSSKMDVIKIDQFLKGSSSFQYLIVNQLDRKDCIQQFEYGELYVIIGFEIKTFAYKENPPSDGMEEPPEYLDIETGVLHILGAKPKYLDYWNGLAASNIVIFANKCTSFKTNSETGQLLLNY